MAKKKRKKVLYSPGDVLRGKATTGRGSTLKGPKRVRDTFLVISNDRDRHTRKRVLVLRPLVDGSIEDKDVLYVGYTRIDKFEGEKIGEAYPVLELPSHDVVVWCYERVLYTYFDAVDAEDVLEALEDGLED